MGTSFRLTLQKWERTSPSRRNTTSVLPAISQSAGNPIGGFLNPLTIRLAYRPLDPFGSRAEVCA